SRRRHTSFSRDWSSDVCSSDLESLSNTQYRDFSRAVDETKGIVGELHGFKIFKRSDVAVGYDDNGTLKIRSYGAAVEATDYDVSFVWQKNQVARAMGEVKFFDNPDRAEYHGDIYSALLRFGGRRRREGNLGVLAIIQDDAT